MVVLDQAGPVHASALRHLLQFFSAVAWQAFSSASIVSLDFDFDFDFAIP